jgi:hypothetical protein
MKFRLKMVAICAFYLKSFKINVGIKDRLSLIPTLILEDFNPVYN